MNKFLKTCFALFVAINFTGMAVAIFIYANLGSDTITVFIDGLARTLNISLGSASRIYNIVMILIALAVARKDIGWCTIVYAFTVGFAMDFYEDVFMVFHIMDANILMKFMWIFIAQFLYGVTYALLIKYRSGMNQVDAITYYICNKFHLKYVIGRTFMDVILLVLGWIMGGVVGIGSVIAMTTTGLFVDFVLKFIKTDTQSA